MKLTPQQKIYFSLVIGVLGFTILVIFLLGPQANKIKTLSEEYQNKQITLETLKKKGTWAEDLRKEYQEIEKERQSIERAFLDPEERIDFIKSLEEIADSTNNQYEIAILSSSVKKEEENLSFHISLWGSFPNLLRFLVYLENMQYFVSVKDIQIQRLGERSIAITKREGLIAGDVATILNIEVYSD